MMAKPVLRIAAACGASKPGGAENYFVRFVTACQNRDYAIEVFPFVRRDSWIASELSDRGIAHEAFGFGGRFDFMTRPRLARTLSMLQPDATMSFMARAASFMPRVDGVVNIARQGGFYQQKNFRTMDHVVAIAPAIAAHVIGGGFTPDRVHLVTNMSKPVDPAFRKQPELRARYGLPQDDFIWLMAGRLHHNKNVDGALKVMARLPRGHHLFIVGTGPDEASLRQEMADLGLQSRVTFHGWVRDISEVAAVADGWFFPSRIEPLGSNTVDAWAHGLPLVAGNVSGPASLITDGVDGILVDPDDINAMAGTLERVASDPALQAALVAAGHATYSARHTEQAVMAEWHGLLARLAGKEQSA